MSEFDYSSKTLRGARKARLSRILRTDPRAKVDSSGYTPPDALDADVKTGLRPVSRRQYKKGGRIKGHEFANEGIPTKPRADRTQRQKHTGFGAEEKAKGERFMRASGGEVVKDLENRDVREINRSRVGSKHVGGFARGGSTKHMAEEGRCAKGGKIGGPRPKGQVEVRKGRHWGDQDDDETSGENRTERPVRAAGGRGSSARTLGVDKIKQGDHVDGYVSPVRKHAEKNAPKSKTYGEEKDDESARENHARGGSAKSGGGPAGSTSRVSAYDADTDGGGRRRGRADGGYLGDIPGTTAAIAKKPTMFDAFFDRAAEELVGGKGRQNTDTAAPKQPAAQPEEVESPIKKWTGKAPGEDRERAITRAVNADDGTSQGPVPMPAGRKRGGRANIMKVTGVDRTGGREARATGGRAKGKTNINIIIGGGKQPVPVPVPGAPMGPPGAAGLHQGAPPPVPPGAPPPAAMPMARKTGGRVHGEGTSYSGGAYGAKVARGLGFERTTIAKPGDPAPNLTSAALGGTSNAEKRRAYGTKALR